MVIIKNDNKKLKELELLNKVYNSENFEIISSEKPDFIIKDKIKNEVIGVEITRMYYDQSSARLKEKKNYVSDILKNNICKQDLGILQPCKLYVQINNEWVFLGDTVSSPPRTFEDYVSRLCNIIKEKDAKCLNYKKTDYYEFVY